MGEALPKRGGRLTKAIGRGLFKLFGWRIVGHAANTPKMVLIGAPHTSNWDFILTMMAMFALGVRFSWVVKHTLFKWPFAGLLDWLGGVPLNRQKTVGFVEQMTAEFERREQFLLAIMPEGTRSKVPGWKSGFYYIACKAQVPIFMVIFNYGEKELCIGPEFYPTGDLTADLPVIQSFFAGVKGKNPA